MPKVISQLDSHLGYWLRFVSNHVSHAFKQKVERHGVTVAEWVVMRTLFDHTRINPSNIAGALGMTRGAISKLLDRLSGKKLVRCDAVKPDRRFQTVELTPAGRALVPRLAALADRNDREFFASLTGPQRQMLMDLLQSTAKSRGLERIPVE